MAKAARLGASVVYRVHAEHHTTTIKTNPDKTETELKGSVHHDSLTEFAGVVGRVHADGSADILLFVPNKPAVWVDGVKQGDGDHEFSLV